MYYEVHDCSSIYALQSLTGKYRGLQGNPCNENRDPAMRTGVPRNENMFFPVGIGSQGVPCELYRVWVCSVSMAIPVADTKSNIFCLKVKCSKGFFDIF